MYTSVLKLLNNTKLLYDQLVRDQVLSVKTFDWCALYCYRDRPNWER